MDSERKEEKEGEYLFCSEVEPILNVYVCIVYIWGSRYEFGCRSLFGDQARSPGVTLPLYIPNGGLIDAATLCLNSTLAC